MLRLNDEMEPVGPPPNDLFLGCNIERRSVIIFFDFLLLLVFELGQNTFASPFCAHPVLTEADHSRCHFDHQERVQGPYVSVTPGSIVLLKKRTPVVYLGTPLLRVIYRDSESFRSTFSLAKGTC